MINRFTVPFLTATKPCQKKTSDICASAGCRRLKQWFQIVAAINDAGVEEGAGLRDRFVRLHPGLSPERGVFGFGGADSVEP